jgi:tRNA(His) 5'-end guanylyltransferase
VITTLRERISDYEEIADTKLLKKLPIIIVCNGRSFRKLTAPLQKPFSTHFLEMMCAIMLKLCQEIDGSVIGYTFNDEIIIVSRNDNSIDTEAWYDNRIQKIVSVVSSIATLECLRLSKSKEINFFGDPIFITKTFAVPNITEAINTLILKQQQAFNIAVYNTCFYELGKRYSSDVVNQTLADKSTQSKLEILSDECNIDFNMIGLPFIRGVAAYRAPKIIHTDGGDKIRNKLILDTDLPLFAKDQNFLSNILNFGKGIVKI